MYLYDSDTESESILQLLGDSLFLSLHSPIFSIQFIISIKSYTFKVFLIIYSGAFNSKLNDISLIIFYNSLFYY